MTLTQIVKINLLLWIIQIIEGIPGQFVRRPVPICVDNKPAINLLTITRRLSSPDMSASITTFFVTIVSGVTSPSKLFGFTSKNNGWTAWLNHFHSVNVPPFVTGWSRTSDCDQPNHFSPRFWCSVMFPVFHIFYFYLTFTTIRETVTYYYYS